jgi:hypothetical protein
VTPKPNPALVTQDAVRRLPRLALLLFCAAYVLPGLFGRDPWRGAELIAFGQMLSIAEGRAPWLAPALGGVPIDAALLPHWIGALAIRAGQGWLDPALAARLPFTALLVLTLVAVWYATFHLARSDAAQPLPFAFGGEAKPVDYARAMADGALLLLIATLGLLQLGHQTTPELAQLAAVAGLQWALAAAPHRGRPAQLGVLAMLPTLAACGAPAMAVALGMGGLLLCWRTDDPALRALRPWLALATALAALVAWPSGAWVWRVAASVDPVSLGRLLLWFLWPAWPLALWTLWRWRGHLAQRHLAIPLLGVGVAAVTCVAMDGSDRALMLGLPGIAVLAAFALPTLQRGSAAAIDWLSVFFFTVCAGIVWVFYASMQTGAPAKALATVLRLAPGFSPQMSWLALALGQPGHAGLAGPGALAHRPSPGRDLEERGAACRRRGAVLAAADDLVAALAGLWPQQPPAGGAAGAPCAGRTLHRGAAGAAVAGGSARSARPAAGGRNTWRGRWRVSGADAGAALAGARCGTGRSPGRQPPCCRLA